MISSLVISVSPMAEKQNIFFPDDKILCDADCEDMSGSGDILNSLGPIRISFARWVYLFKINIITHVPVNEHRSTDQSLKSLSLSKNSLFNLW